MPWKIASCTVLGPGHRTEGRPCQDSSGHCYISDGDITIGVVSDGAGSATYSEWGSKVAARAALFHAKGFVITSQFVRGEPQVRQCPRHIISNVRKELEEEAFTRHCLLSELACTLVVFIASSRWLTAVQIGDGFIVYKRTNGAAYELLFVPHKGEFANETTFITSKNFIDTAQVYSSPLDVEFICASTDGIDHVSLDKPSDRQWMPHQRFFKPLHEELVAATDPDAISKELAQFLDSASVTKITSDDKGVVLALHQPQPVNEKWTRSQPSGMAIDGLRYPEGGGDREKASVRQKEDARIGVSHAEATDRVYSGLLMGCRRASKRLLAQFIVVTRSQSAALWHYAVRQLRAKGGSLVPESKSEPRRKFRIWTVSGIGLVALIIWTLLLVIWSMETTDVRMYTYEIYALQEGGKHAVGFLVVGPSSIRGHNRGEFEAWLYHQSPSEYIDISKTDVAIRPDAPAIVPIYNLESQSDVATRLPIGYVYPGASMRYESIEDIDVMGVRRVKLRFSLDR